ARMPNSAEHIRKKLPSMYHQFKQLADIDITKEPMEVGPTTHYIMGGVRVDADTQMSSVPGLFAAGECAAGINGANRLGGNSLSDILVFGKRAGEFAAKFAREHRQEALDLAQADAAARRAVEPVERAGEGGGAGWGRSSGASSGRRRSTAPRRTRPRGGRSSRSSATARAKGRIRCSTRSRR